MRAALASIRIAKFFVKPQPSCAARPAPDSVVPLRSSALMLDASNDSPSRSLDVFTRGSVRRARTGSGVGAGFGIFAGAWVGACVTGCAGGANGDGCSTACGAVVVGFAGVVDFAGVDGVADPTGAVATATVVVATLSEDAFAFVSCT